MYFVETGLGETFKPREQTKTPPTRQRPQPPRKVPPKAPPKEPPDRLTGVYTHWDLWVPFRKDIETFGQEVAKAIGRHVAANEKTTVNRLLEGLQSNLEVIHNNYVREKSRESNFVIVRATLRFTKNDHTGFDWLNIEFPK
jgi:hypothetical protein